MREAIFWMSGSLAGVSLTELKLPGFILICSLLLSLAFSKQLDAMLLGEEEASIIGVNVKVVRNIMVVIIALLTGAVVSISGVIGFLGLMVPHICRNFFGIKHTFLIPVASFTGAIFLVWADVAARMVFRDAELPIGVVTSLCGALFFICLMRNSSYKFGGRE